MTEKLPGTDLVGWTYDVFGECSEPTSRLKCVVPVMAAFEGASYDAASDKTVTIEGSTYYYPSICSFLHVDQSTVSVDYASSSADIEFELAAKLHIKAKRGAFSGTMSAKYSKEESRQSETQYILITDNFDHGHIELPNLSQASFDPAFWTALNDTSVSAKTLFKTYGTHIVTGLIIGGHFLASFHASKSDSYSESTFTADAQIKYNSLAGSVRVGGSMDTSSSSTIGKVNVSDEISIIGGDTTQTDWDTWSKTVAGDPVAVTFTSNGLTPIWNYCSSSSRAQDLSTQFDDLYRLVHSGASTRDYAPQSDHATSGNTFLGWGLADVPTTQLQAGDSTESLALTGFGCRINSSRHVTRIGIEMTDIMSGNKYYFAKGDTTTFNINDYETFDTVPSGTVMTGIALREANERLNNMALHYQALGFIDYGSSSEDSHVGDVVSIRYKSHSGSTASFSGWEQNYVPTNPSAGYVLTGLEVASSDKHGGFCTLNVLRTKLSRKIDL
ncbi:hypothetical protein N825_02095 [Skermanella stibiiresistens SB22]|uniref:MACPF domain-containing protein n=1 Tax=Skermanella stibiiresistens SB22 TaxID=1385369 RepID=W9HA62_9PROT|nr:MAC/perforin domain-containing protein [Skermanella stibiiresistens]EWY42864.1 hypothetical protein N825_02095 [Skermanella stibiiresistens SB22]